MRTMPLITLLAPKWGFGKTTAALLLAIELAEGGGSVVIVDADPKFPLAKWAGLPGKPDNIEVVQEVDEDAIIDTIDAAQKRAKFVIVRSEEHTSELQSLMRISYAVFCLKKKKL